MIKKNRTINTFLQLKYEVDHTLQSMEPDDSLPHCQLANHQTTIVWNGKSFYWYCGSGLSAIGYLMGVFQLSSNYVPWSDCFPGTSGIRNHSSVLARSGRSGLQSTECLVVNSQELGFWDLFLSDWLIARPQNRHWPLTIQDYSSFLTPRISLIPLTKLCDGLAATIQTWLSNGHRPSLHTGGLAHCIMSSSILHIWSVDTWRAQLGPFPTNNGERVWRGDLFLDANQWPTIHLIRKVIVHPLTGMDFFHTWIKRLNDDLIWSRTMTNHQ